MRPAEHGSRIDAAVAARAQRYTKPLPTKRRLPPYARQWIDSGRRYGPMVIIGPDAWARAARHGAICMVVPDDEDPLAFDWRCLAGLPVVLIETGVPDTPRLDRTAYALLVAGVPMITPIRTAMLELRPPQVWPRYVQGVVDGR